MFHISSKTQGYRYLTSKEFPKLQYSYGIEFRGDDHREYRNIALRTEDDINIFISQLYLRVKLYSQAPPVPRFIFQELLMQDDKVPVHFVEVAYVLFETYPAGYCNNVSYNRLFFFLSFFHMYYPNRQIVKYIQGIFATERIFNLHCIFYFE